MDCAITSPFPAAGAPPPAGADVPAGSGAELAALFASLVADLGEAGAADTADAAAPSGAGPHLPETPGQPAEGELEPPVTPGAMPWWLAVPSSAEAAPAAVAETSAPPQTPALDLTSAVISADPHAPVGTDPLAAPAAAPPAPGPTNASDGAIAGATAPTIEPPSGPVADAPVLPAVTSSPAPSAPPQAARALARALAALDETAPPVREHAAAGTAGATASIDHNPADGAPPATEAQPAPTARAVEPNAVPRANAHTTPLPVAAVAVHAAGSADGGTSQPGSGGAGYPSRHAEPAPAGQPRALPAPDTILDALLPSHAPQGLLSRAPAGGAALPQGPGSVSEHETAVADQLVQAIRIRAGEGTGEARLRLNPEFLGEVRIELKITGDRVRALLHVERDDVRQQIESGTPALRAALAAHGLELDEVTVREDDSSEREGSPQQRREPRERKRRDEPADTFELPD